MAVLKEGTGGVGRTAGVDEWQDGRGAVVVALIVNLVQILLIWRIRSGKNCYQRRCTSSNTDYARCRYGLQYSLCSGLVVFCG